jgi:hypothetical protein
VDTARSVLLSREGIDQNNKAFDIYEYKLDEYEP